jgi:hypothetical protein
MREMPQAQHRKPQQLAKEPDVAQDAELVLRQNRRATARAVWASHTGLRVERLCRVWRRRMDRWWRST